MSPHIGLPTQKNVWRCSIAALITSVAVAFTRDSIHQHDRVCACPSQSRSYSYFGRGRGSSTSENSARSLRDVEEYDDAIHLLSELRQTSYDALLERIPPSVSIVLIGEGTHGTEEFFRVRSEVTRHLVQHRGFGAILCEGDVQPFFELNEFVADDRTTADGTAKSDALDQDIRSMLSRSFYGRFPDWMWSNVPMVSLISWLKSYNCNSRRSSSPVQLLGMDVQSPFDSADYIIQKLSSMGEIELSDFLQKSYEPLLRYRSNIRRYGNDVYGNKVPSQENAVKSALDALFQKREERNDAIRSGRSRRRIDDAREQDAWFRLIQNGHVVRASEAYHRQRIYPGHTATWNLRTESMMNSIVRSKEHIEQKMNNSIAPPGCEEEAPSARLIVWAHNSHVGDMRSTSYSRSGQISLGQLCREEFGDDQVFLMGTTTYEGTVRAANADRQGACWKGEGNSVALKKARADSHESVLHSIAVGCESAGGKRAFGLYLQTMRANEGDAGVGINGSIDFNCDRYERFVGSCYLPQTEMMSHYAKCNLATQFDYVVHVDESSAIEM